MRYFDIEALSVETAGQSSVGSLIHLAGIKDGREFRDAVLAQRDLIVGTSGDKPAGSMLNESTNTAGASAELLTEIRDTLKRIEKHLER